MPTSIPDQIRNGGNHNKRPTSNFSKGARDEAARSDATPVALMNGDQLVTLLMEHDIGVRRTKHDLIELGDEEEAEA